MASASLGQTPDQLKDAFASLRSARGVADLLDVEYKHLAYHLSVNGQARAYTSFTIPKKSGARRVITAPVSPLKLIQKKLNQVLQAVYEPRAAVHGFLPNRSIVSNARPHSGQLWVLNVDLEDFFPSIHFGRVRGLFRAWPYSLPDRVALVLARICCYRSQLPQGAPTSPIVSNMICAQLDTQLLRLAQRFRCIYTRYADDISISTSMSEFPSALARMQPYPKTPEVVVGKAMRAVIERNSFQVNERKVRMRHRDRRQEVTGLTVNRFPNVRKPFVRQLRAMLHAWEKYGLKDAETEYRTRYFRKCRANDKWEPSFRRAVEGKLAFLEMVRGRGNSTFARLYGQYLKLIGKTPHHALWILESKQDKIQQGTGFALDGVGVVTCAHVLAPDTKAWQADSYATVHDVATIAEDAHLDLAIAELDPMPTHFLRRGDSTRLAQGDPVTLLGFPKYNVGHTVKEETGTVTGFGMRFGARLIYLSTSVLPGHSGGPVLDAQDRVVGVAIVGKEWQDAAVSIEDLNRLPGGPWW